MSVLKSIPVKYNNKEKKKHSAAWFPLTFTLFVCVFNLFTGRLPIGLLKEIVLIQQGIMVLGLC